MLKAPNRGLHVNPWSCSHISNFYFLYTAVMWTAIVEVNVFEPQAFSFSLASKELLNITRELYNE